MKEKNTEQKNFIDDKKNNKLIKRILMAAIALILIVIIFLFVLNLFNKEVSKYNITFESNGGSLVEDFIVEENNTITKPEDPIKEDYEFIGWYYNDELYDFSKPVTSNIKLEARWKKIEEATVNENTVEKNETYAETIRKYTVTFKDEDGTSLTSDQTVEYGNKVTEPTEPTKQGHIFQGWYNGNTRYIFTEEVKGNIELTARWTKHTYTIVFTNDDGSILEIKKVEYGTLPTCAEPTSTNLSDEQYSYIFTGWSPNPTPANQYATYTAIYEKTTNKYEVVFQDEDGTSLVNTQNVEYGSKAIEPEEPIKKGHTFQGWYNGEEKYTFTEEVKGKVTLTAKWTKNKYTITFVNEDATILETQTVEFGMMPTYTGPIPTKAADSKYTYVFEGWNPTLTAVEDDTTYTARFTSIYVDYVIRFVDEDGTELSQKIYHFGDTIEQPMEPKKDSDEQFTYTFAGWNPSVTTVEKDMTYTATYTATLNKYDVTFKDEDGTILADTQIVEYGSKATEPTEPTKKGHTFKGWYNGNTEYTFMEEVKGNVTLTAKWEKNKYTITFVNYDGVILETKTVEYGEMPTYTTPTKAGNQQYTYTFAGWNPSLVEVEKDAIYTAIYVATINKYDVIFKDEDGTELSNTQAVEYGSTATEPTEPTKQGYTFQGWYIGENRYTFTEEVKEDVTLTAKWTKNKYTVTFMNDNGDTLETQILEYEAIPVYTGQTPIKQADKTYTYSFKGWDKELVKVTDHVTYTATYTATYIEYVIKFVDEDGTELNQKTYHYGDVVRQPVIPTKPANEQYTYTFAGWNPSVTTVEKDVTYTATYTATINKYDVTFKNEDGTTLADTQSVEYGSQAIEPTEPTKEGYTFQGWYNGDTKYTFTEEVKGNVELTARWTKNKYTIKFVNEDGTVLESKILEYGIIPTYSGETPTKSTDAQYTYTFAGWNPSIKTVTNNATYTATYTATINKYEVTFKDEDGTTLANTQTVEYGSQATEPTEPTKEGYIFQGWYNGDVKYTFTEEVNGNVELTAKWEKNKYTITFVNYDGTTLETQAVEHGIMPTYTGETPTKSADNTYTYSFNGWDKELVEATSDVTYTATYVSAYIDYVIIFADDNGTVLNQKTYHYGDTVEQPSNPTKLADAQYTYEFAGWNPNVTTVEKDMTYTATYTGTINKYEVTFKDEDGTTLANTQTVEYGSKATEPSAPTRETYTFQGWYNGDTKYTFTEEVKGNVELTARWEKNKYTITFVNYDGTTLKTQIVEHGITPTYTGETPTRPADNTYSYTFTGWSPAISAAEKDMTYKAQYKSFTDVDAKLEKAISEVSANAKQFDVIKTGNTINVKFVPYTENGEEVEPPYELIDLVPGVINLLDKLSSDPSYESFNLYYGGQTIDLTDYDFSDTSNISSFMGVARWLANLCGKSLFGLMDATTEDLVKGGKVVEITINLNGDNVLEDGSKTAKYYLTFSY